MEKIRIGIIGAGRIGKLHAENVVKLPEVELKAISDIFAEQIIEWATSLGIKKVTNDYKTIITDPEIDAIFICSPTNTHTDIIAEAAAAGKHIFCEKPISFDIGDTKKSLQLVQEAGVKLQIGFNRRFDHNFKKVREVVASGKVGDPHIIKVTSRDPNPPSPDYIKVSGGIFIDMTIHDFDMARYLSGSDVEEVYVQGAVLVDPVFDEYGDIDTAIITLKFENGCIGVIDNSRKAVYGYDQRVEVFGSKGSVTVANDHPNSVEVSTEECVYHDKPKYFFLERYQEAFIEEVKLFVECILHDKDTVVNGYDGLQAELIAYAAKKSWEEKRPVKLAEFHDEIKIMA
ncbi:inositol 2-dehydrogenase [Aneurinibacillus migulanus]|uniref:Myo-inositol 2-dehydrogenase / D-chiro-inositol 1-dehydrogenase n=1 Tax=Aneurinibacillus migulanus TaxID=47500 RepID=A0A0D1XND3_ANEMI|nr:inositol 2-dehydrogenase [Aneurinibacillus migulanus]KIV53668.1 oxidoreductase [Aneurinibacillus migulanus]KON97675.1 oxidoreductase [Aneurinibacillus migulanus]MED0894431.1 inositol 2-dehydrogenase [Aneurinibacillus migulanus]MED1617041.1 inositol 2-dehydrogenase [Aneurinibacillus migulanus]SDJ35496.1 myo-inositol 2-dehydrogenase / D-chiro-inositol 1-dehydrogenase [Aneurinibacillus migulanus]